MTTAASGSSPTGTGKAALTVVQSSPRPPYRPSKVSEGGTLTVTGTFLSHGRQRGDYLQRSEPDDQSLRDDRIETTIATQGRERNDELPTLWE
jgi:hypothetical protein